MDSDSEDDNMPLSAVATGTTATFSFNYFTPEFPEWTLPSLILGTSVVANKGFSQKLVTEGQMV